MEQESKESWGEWPVEEGTWTTDDPRQRVSRLPAASRPPMKVGPCDTLARAVTIMLTNDFSQLPVMSGNRDVKGVVSWQSIAKRRKLPRMSAPKQPLAIHP